MDIKGLSDNGLKSLHKGIQYCLDADNKTPAGKDKPHGVKEFPDWARWRDTLEAELERRQLPYTPIKF